MGPSQSYDRMLGMNISGTCDFSRAQVEQRSALRAGARVSERHAPRATVRRCSPTAAPASLRCRLRPASLAVLSAHADPCPLPPTTIAGVAAKVPVATRRTHRVPRHTCRGVSSTGRSEPCTGRCQPPSQALEPHWQGTTPISPYRVQQGTCKFETPALTETRVVVRGRAVQLVWPGASSGRAVGIGIAAASRAVHPPAPNIS